MLGTYTIIVGGLIYLRANNENTNDGDEIDLIKEILHIS